MADSSNKKIYRAAVIGCGRIGSSLEDDIFRNHPCTHAGGYQMHPRTEIVAGCDIKADRRKHFSEKWSVKDIYKSFRTMLDVAKPDIVSIAVPTRLHCLILDEAVKSGVKGVLLEKPVDVNLGRARRSIENAKASGVVVLVNHTRRWNIYYRQALEWINNGEIGDLIGISGWSLGGGPIFADDIIRTSRRAGGGTLLHDGTHLLDAMRMFAGEAEWVYGNIRLTPGAAVEDGLHGLVGFKNGVVGSVDAGGPRNYFAFELDLSGSKGRIRIGNGLMELYRAGKSRRFQGFSELRKVNWNLPEKASNFFYECVDNIVGILDGEAQPVSDGFDGLAALELVYGLYKSAETGRKIDLPLKGVSRSPLTRMVESLTISNSH